MDLEQGRRGAFVSEAERKTAWAENRERLMARLNPCTRPQAWWDYECKTRRDPHRSQDEQLYVLNALSPSEVRLFTERCRAEGRRLSSLPKPGYRVRDPLACLRNPQEGAA